MGARTDCSLPGASRPSPCSWGVGPFIPSPETVTEMSPSTVLQFSWNLEIICPVHPLLGARPLPTTVS